MTITTDGVIKEYTGPNVSLVLNGNKFIPQVNQMPPIIINNRTLVPVRFISENAGLKVEWDPTTYTVSINKDNLVDSNLNNDSNIFMKYGSLLNENIIGSSDKKVNDVRTITIVNSIEVPKNALESWDVSLAKDKSVIAWILQNKEDKEMYDLYFGANGKISFCDDSAMFFFNNYKNCETIMGLENLNTSKVTNFSGLFSWCEKLKTIGLSSLDTSNATQMMSMFNSCKNLTTIDVSTFNTDNVTNMKNMFLNCKGLTEIDLSSFDTSNVETMSGMFDNCVNLTKLDLSNFDTKNVEDMSFMFSDCSNLTELNLSSFGTSKVTDMSYF